jgi:hypothetical protein
MVSNKSQPVNYSPAITNCALSLGFDCKQVERAIKHAMQALAQLTRPIPVLFHVTACAALWVSHVSGSVRMCVCVGGMPLPTSIPANYHSIDPRPFKLTV